MKDMNQKLEMKCSSCGHEWNYTGNKEFPAFVTCPGCGTKTRLRKPANEVET